MSIVLPRASKGGGTRRTASIGHHQAAFTEEPDPSRTGDVGFLTPRGVFRTIHTRPRWASYIPRPSEAGSGYTLAQCTE